METARRYLFLEDAQRALGVWELEADANAARAKMSLALRYPGCRAVLSTATDFESLKAAYGEIQFGSLVPDPY